jgi:uncharacterized protein
MIIDLAQMEEPSRPFETSIPADELDLDNPTFRLTGEVRASGEIRKGSAQIDVNGSIIAPAEIDCARCLEPIARELTIDFAASFVAPENFAADKEREVSAEDLDVDVLESDQLDLNQLVREQIVLNFPEQVFCEPDCKGLCPKCGANRNLIDCNCDLDETDPRWEALKNLKGSK